MPFIKNAYVSVRFVIASLKLIKRILSDCLPIVCPDYYIKFYYNVQRTHASAAETLTLI